MLFLGHTGTDKIVELNVHTRAVHTVPVGSIPCAVAIDPRKQMLYAVNYGSATFSAIIQQQTRWLPSWSWATNLRPSQSTCFIAA
jgi:hypothetical protein